MLKPDCAPAVEEPLPVLAGAAPVLTAEDAGLERVTPRPADEPAAVPEAPILEVPCKAIVADPRLHCESEHRKECQWGRDALTRRWKRRMKRSKRPEDPGW